jgi:hypothetical protein
MYLRDIERILRRLSSYDPESRLLIIILRYSKEPSRIDENLGCQDPFSDKLFVEDSPTLVDKI